MAVLRHLLAGTLGLALALAAAQPQRIGVLVTIGTFANGLTKTFHEGHSVPVVTTNLVELDTFRLPLSSATEFRALGNAVSIANLRRVARLVVAVDRLTVAAAGNLTILRPSIEALLPGVASVPDAAVIAR